MDRNEDFEKNNRITKLHLEGLTHYPIPLKSSKRARRLENFSSLWKEEQVLRPRKKPKRLSESEVYGGCFEQLGRDTLLRSLSLLDLRSLIRCTSVGKSLNKTIRSPELRRLWSANQPPVVLVSSYTLPCRLLVPGSSSPAELFPPLTGENVAGAPLDNALVVASDRGLVCVRFNDPVYDDSGLDLAVGNPLTREWVALPKSLTFGFRYNYRFRMKVSEDKRGSEDGVGYRVHFKVAGFSTSFESHCYHVFDSATGNWSITRLDFPPWTAFKWSVFDLRSCSWRTELIRNWSIRTGLERSPGEVHRLPHPGLHGFDEWEYKGSTYFAAVWTVEQEMLHAAQDAAGEFAGYGVWKVQRGGEVLETVAAVWARDLGASQDGISVNCCGVNNNYVAACSAAGNLVCFGGESFQSPTMPLVVYNIETGGWSMFDEQHPPLPDSCFSGNHYAACVAYAPSLLVAPHKQLNAREDGFDAGFVRIAPGSVAFCNSDPLEK